MIRNIDMVVNLESKTSCNCGLSICFLFIPVPLCSLENSRLVLRIEQGFDGFLKKSFHVIDNSRLGSAKNTERTQRGTVT